MFLVLEGIDGAGKGRQRIELIEHMKSLGMKNIDGVEFPDHQGVLYKTLIKPHLLREIKISKSALFLSFALDQILFESRILEAKGSKDKHFICDGYFTTNLVYNCLVDSSITLKQALEFATIFKIPEPDLNIFIDVEPKVALKRKSGESGHDKGLDYLEKDLNKQHQIREGFKKMVSESIFGHWLVVDGSESIEQVKNEIINTLNESKLISFNI